VLFIVGCNNNNKNASSEIKGSDTIAPNKEFMVLSGNDERERIKDDTISSFLEEGCFEQFKGDKISLYKKYLISEDTIFKNISIPFSSRRYIDDDNRDETYIFYRPSDLLVNYLVSKDYEGEEYKCYVLPPKNKGLILLVWIPRGDSEYYLLVLLDSEKIITHKEIGTGGDDSVLFIIQENFFINRYNNSGNLESFLVRNNDIIPVSGEGGVK
jgi:hypothetical protein